MLQSIINIDSPDKTETKVDASVQYISYWTETDTDVFERINVGWINRKKTYTIKTWFACSQAAVNTFIGTYDVDGAIDPQCMSDVIKSYDVTLTESVVTEEWHYAEEE